LFERDSVRIANALVAAYALAADSCWRLALFCGAPAGVNKTWHMAARRGAGRRVRAAR